MTKTILLLPLFFISFLSYSLGRAIEQKNQRFEIKTLNKGPFNTTKKITYYYYDQEIGCIYYEHLPLSFFVIHTFFIQQKYRNHGHGTELLEFACREIKKSGTRKIIIQPGPFEQSGDTFTDIPSHERAQRLELIVRLYKKVGFSSAPRIISCLAGYLYKLMDIPEDAHYLMLL